MKRRGCRDVDDLHIAIGDEGFVAAVTFRPAESPGFFARGRLARAGNRNDIGEAQEICRHTCRAEAERRFSTEIIVGDYEQLYLDLCRN